MSFLHFDAFEALEVVNHCDLAVDLGAVAMNANGGLAHGDFAGVNFAESDPAEVIGVIQVCDEELKAIAGEGARRRDVFHDGVEERFHRAADVAEVEFGVAFLGAGVNEREIELLIGGVEGNEQVENRVQHLLRVGVLAVDLIDDDDGFGAGFQGLAEDEACLRLRSVGRVHHEQHAVDHAHGALDFAAEVGVAGGVHDVDMIILVLERSVLGADGDALFAFEIHRIHDAFLVGDGLIGAERAGLFEQAIHERRLAMINVRDDRDVPNMLHVEFYFGRLTHASR